MCGKGDTYRPVDAKKYDINMLLLFGVGCPCCGGEGVIEGAPALDDMCRLCLGAGIVEKWKAKRYETWGDEIL